MTTPGYGQDPRGNPFARPYQPQPQSYSQQQRGDYDEQSDMGDHYNSVNGSSVRLAADNGYYNQPGPFFSLSKFLFSFTIVYSYPFSTS